MADKPAHTSPRQDLRSVEDMVEECRPKLSSFVKGRVGNREDAEDVVQDVLYRLFRALADNAVQIENISAWMFTVARNTIFNLGRKKRETSMPAPHSADDGTGDTAGDDDIGETLFGGRCILPDDEYLRSLVWDELEAALDELPCEQRRVFEMTELEGFAIKDIAEATGIAAATLLSRKHYAVKHLRVRLAGLYNDIISF